jgi:hypothetical protein
MTRNASIHAVLALALLLAPSSAAGQIGVAARGGTLGIGAEAALGLSDRLVLRGGVGLQAFDVSTTFDSVAVDLELPDSWYNVGIDLYLNGAFRVGAGILFKSDDPRVTGTLEGPVDIGGRTFTPEEIGTLTGVLDSREHAPYVLLGFGKHTDAGLGLSLDVGAAFTGDPDVTLDAQGGTFSDQQELQSRLDQEAQDFEDDMRTYLRIWPILSLGVRLGLG